MLNLEYTIVKSFGVLLPVGVDGVDFIVTLGLTAVTFYTFSHLRHSRYKHLRVSRLLDKIF